MKKRLFDIARGAIGQANINAEELNLLPLPVQPLRLQRRYLHLVETALSTVADVDSRSRTTSELSAALIFQLLRKGA